MNKCSAFKIAPDNLTPDKDPVHTIPVRNETVTKKLRLGLLFTRYCYEKA